MKMNAIPKILAIDSMDISQLSGDLHKEFVSTLLKCAEKEPAVVKYLPKELQLLREAVNFEMQMSLKEDNGQYTKQIYAEADRRDKIQTALKSGLRAAMGKNDVAVQEAARELLLLMKEYKLRARKNVDAHTAELSSFIKDVKDNCMASIESTQTTELFHELEEQNNRVSQLVTERDWSKVGKKRMKMRNVRKQTNAAYRYFVYAVNAQAFVQGYREFVNFIRLVNVLILRYKRTHLHEHVAAPTTAEIQEMNQEIFKEK